MSIKSYSSVVVTDLSNGIISSVDIWYYLSDSEFELSGGSWDTNPPEWENGKYYWQKVITTYNNGNTNESDPVCITGAKGNTGATGTGIASITEEYYLSTSKTSQTGGSWSTTPPTWSPDKYIWTRSKIVYTNPSSTVYTTPICDSSWEAVNEIEVGGRNILVGTNQGKYKWINAHNGGSYGIEDVNWNGVNAVKMTCTTATTSWRMFTFGGLLDNFEKLEPGGTYTLSYDVIGSIRANLNDFMDFDATDRLIGRFIQSKKDTTDYGYHYEYIIVLKDQLVKSSQVVYLENKLTDNTEVIIANLKLEKGNKATDWTPAPEDTETKIDTLISDVKDIKTTTEMVVDKENNCIKESILETTFLYKPVLDANGNYTYDESGNIIKEKDAYNIIERTMEQIKDLNGVITTVGRSDADGLRKSITTAQQTADKFYWLVEKDSISSSLTLTESALTAITNQFIVKSPNGQYVVIENGGIKADSITSDMLATNSIKSRNYTANTDTTSPYSKLGTYLDLSNGNIYTPNFGVNGSNVYVKGEINALSGNISGFTIENNYLHINDKSSINDGSITLSSVDFSRVINDSEKTGLRFAIGNNFGVKKDGSVYATSGELSNITATNLHITGDSTFDGVLNGATGNFSGEVTASLLNVYQEFNYAYEGETLPFAFVVNTSQGEYPSTRIGTYCVDDSYLGLIGSRADFGANGYMNLYSSDNMIIHSETNINITAGTGISLGANTTVDGGLTVFGASTYNSSINASGNITTSGSFYAGNTSYGSTCVELYGNPPYIDFHAANSTADHTSRIIDWGDRMEIYPSDKKLIMTGNIHFPDGLGIYNSTNGSWLVRMNDATNHSNLASFGASGQKTSIYGSGNIWKNGSASTYFATTSSSDRRLKDEVYADMSPYEDFFMRLSPVAFKYHDGLYNAENRAPLIQWGFYAQDTIEAFNQSRLDWTTHELVVVEDGELSSEELKYVNEDDMLKMNYQNMTALNTYMIQKNHIEIAQLKEQIEILTLRLNQLQASA